MNPVCSRELALISEMQSEEELTDEILALRSVIRELDLLKSAAHGRLQEVKKAPL